MIFLGDISVPTEVSPRINYPVGLFQRTSAIANLEGAISVDRRPRASATRFYNSAATLSFLEDLNICAVSMANNHIMDFATPPSTTAQVLALRGILSCGAGDDWSEAKKPALLHTASGEIAVLAFGWEQIGCKAATNHTPGINPLRPLHVLASIAAARREHPHARVVAFMHWDYELELYPQPMHRQLAFAAVEAGADAIVGSHPHCVQGIEIFKNAPIVYSLGNWFIPEGAFFGPFITYPKRSDLQLAFEWEPTDGSMICHWFTYERDTQTIVFITSETLTLGKSQLVRDLTPFAEMSHDEYIAWFRAHRARRRGLPIYRDYRSGIENNLKHAYIRTRQHSIRMLAGAGIKWRSDALKYQNDLGISSDGDPGNRA